MTVYRELIERQLAVRQAGLQIGLQKANEQEPFIAAVAETLSRTMWGYAMRMDARFEVTFVVNLGYVAFEHQFAAVKQVLAEKFEVEADGDALTVELDAAGFEKAYTAMVSLKGDGGRPLAIRPNVLLVPPALENAAKELVEGDRLANGAQSIVGLADRPSATRCGQKPVQPPKPCRCPPISGI